VRAITPLSASARVGRCLASLLLALGGCGGDEAAQETPVDSTEQAVTQECTADAIVWPAGTEGTRAGPWTNSKITGASPAPPAEKQ
jgi:hypothetical protein